MLTMDRIRGRLVDIELEKVEPFGHEKGMLFEVKASDSIEAETKLRAEIEAFFA